MLFNISFAVCRYTFQNGRWLQVLLFYTSSLLQAGSQDGGRRSVQAHPGNTLESQLII